MLYEFVGLRRSELDCDIGVVGLIDIGKTNNDALIPTRLIDCSMYQEMFVELGLTIIRWFRHDSSTAPCPRRFS